MTVPFVYLLDLVAGGGALHRSSCTFSECGPSRRLNADAVAASDANGFYAVADGIGSAAESAEASYLAVQGAFHFLRQCTEELQETIDWGALISRLHEVHMEAFRHLHKIPGTTLTIAAIGERILQFSTFGDSPVFLIDGGRIILLSKYHTAIDQHRITSNFSDLKSQNGSNVVVNALGHNCPLPIAYEPIELHRPCRLIIASDGLMDVVSQRELGELSERCSTAMKLKREIISRANRTKPRDNYSGVIVDIMPRGGK